MRWVLQASRSACQVVSQVSRARVCAPAITQLPRYYSTPLNLLPDVDFEELNQMLEKKSITLLDVRPPEELEDVGMIPQAKNLVLQPLGINILLSDEEFKEKVGFDKPKKDDPIVVTCLLGIRARTAQLALMAAGYTNVRRYKGSFTDWLEKKGPVVFPEKKEETK